MGYKVSIHAQAIVDDTVEIGEGTSIWQFATVIRHTKIGRNCNIWPYALIDRSVIGNGTVAASGIVMGGAFKVGNNCFLGPNTTFCNDMWPSASKEGFDEEKFLDDSHWAVIVEDNVGIGANCIILPGVRIGKGAVIAAGSRVDRDVPEGYLWRGDNQIFPLGKDRKRERMRWAK